MTPSAFLKQYTDMQVCVVPQGGDVTDGVWTPVHVKKYHLGASPYREILWHDVGGKLVKGTQVKVRTIAGQDVTSPLLTHSQLWNLFRFPFVGKASPEQIQATIQLLYRFRQNKSTVEQFAGGVGKQNEYNFIGLDCNGFVGNYLQRIAWNKYEWMNQKNAQDPGPDSMIKDLFLTSTDPVYDISDFRTRGNTIYILVFCSPEGKIYDHGDGPGGAGHIMISDPGVKSNNGNGVTLVVSESTAANIAGSGGGPATSDYIIKEVLKPGNQKTNTHALFLVWRGGSSSMKMPVKIGSLK